MIAQKAGCEVSFENGNLELRTAIIGFYDAQV